MNKDKEKQLIELIETTTFETVPDAIKWIDDNFISKEEVRKEMIEIIKDYQNGWIREGADGEPERAFEWQVIDNLLSSPLLQIKDKEI